MEKIKELGNSIITKARNAKFAVGALAASAAVPVFAVVASAEDGTGGSGSTATGLSQYSSQITSVFTDMVDDVMPIAVGVLGAGATIFGLFVAFKLARRAIGTVAK